MTSAAEWLARAVCGQGHALYGPGDLVVTNRGVECSRCCHEMRRERQLIAGAGMARRAAGRAK